VQDLVLNERSESCPLRGSEEGRVRTGTTKWSKLEVNAHLEHITQVLEELPLVFIDLEILQGFERVFAAMVWFIG